MRKHITPNHLQFATSVFSTCVISALLLQGCINAPSSMPGTTTTSSNCTSTTSTSDMLNNWMINSSNERSLNIFETGSSLGVLVNVQSVASVACSGSNYIQVQATGVPNYSVTMTAADITALNSRPKASTDFLSGSTTASAGNVVKFGQNIGFNSNSTCSTNGGTGYWPPGPKCPKNVSHNSYFPINPTASTTSCKSGMGAIGYWENGSSIYQWSDGGSYNNQNIWHTLAPVAEQYDVDICGGHAANGDYHHHFHSSCMANQLNDNGTTHSPVYGYAADGYPIYGPWESNGVLAKSSWVVRDYANAGSATGCGSVGVRNCVLVDQYDISKGTTTATTGPTTSASYTTMSGNNLTASAGFFYEDYYWSSALTNLGGEYLDNHNGHTDGTRGYHYHVTTTLSSGKLVPAFPYTIGPTFYGKLASNAMTSCGT